MKRLYVGILAAMLVVGGSVFTACKNGGGDPPVNPAYQGVYAGSGDFIYLRVEAGTVYYGSNASSVTAISNISTGGGAAVSGGRWDYVYMGGAKIGIIAVNSSGEVMVGLGAGQTSISSFLSSNYGVSADFSDLSSSAPNFYGELQY